MQEITDLTQAEKDGIIARRAVALRNEIIAAETAAYQLQAKADERSIRAAIVNKMRAELLAADKDGILTSTGGGMIGFKVNGNFSAIDVEIKRPARFSNTCPKYHYHISGAVIDYKDKWFITTKLVLRLVDKLQKEYIAMVAAHESKFVLQEEAVALMAKRYPDATVNFESGFDNRRNGRSGSYRPDCIKVKTPSATYLFGFSRWENSVSFYVVKRMFNTALEEQIKVMALGEEHA